MNYLKRKGRLALIAIIGIAVTTFCIEYLSYVHNSRKWPEMNPKEDVIRVLLVADPQIQGERNENLLYGGVTRWDADWYLKKNYQLAKRHVSPDTVVFLGDLFDEGSIASDPEYRRYIKRFSRIFDLPTNQNPSSIKHIFVPGDNDVGGEKEPVDPVKVDWFSKTYGDLRSIVDFTENGLHVQFVKMNLFIPTEYKNPMKGLQNLTSRGSPDIRLILSHVSLLSFMTNSVEQVLESLHPHLIIAAHSHKSSYLRLITGEKKSVHIIHDFLLDGKSHGTSSDPSVEASIAEHRKLFTRSSLLLDTKPKGRRDIFEILVPTCSYRMGVQEMGYGVMQIHKNGTIEYTVLWLPSRFKQLFLYVVIYMMVKLIITPWVFWKMCTFTCRKYREFRARSGPDQYIKTV